VDYKQWVGEIKIERETERRDGEREHEKIERREESCMTITICQLAK
jgi:hypothetical protein